MHMSLAIEMQHLLANFSYDGIRSNRNILNIFHTGLERAGAHIRSSDYYEFDPQGLTATVILSESHATISTWPEKGIMILDYFSCADDPKFDVLIEYLRTNGFECYKSEIKDR